MLIVALVFVFFALLGVLYELHTITDRLIEIGTTVEHANRRSLRRQGEVATPVRTSCQRAGHQEAHGTCGRDKPALA